MDQVNLEDQYYDLLRVSSSILKHINPLEGGSPMKYYDEFHNLVKRKKDSMAVELGKLAHMYKLQPHLFEIESLNKPTEQLLVWCDAIYDLVKDKLNPEIDLFDIISDDLISEVKRKLDLYRNISKEDTLLKTFKTEQVKEYLMFKHSSSDKIMLTQTVKNKLVGIQYALDNNETVNMLIEPSASFSVFKEIPLLFRLKVSPLGGGLPLLIDLKAKPDLVRVNRSKLIIQLIDIKTSFSSAYQLNNFLSYRIYRQLAVYRQAILKNIEFFGLSKDNLPNITFEYKIIAVETQDRFHCVVHKINPMWITSDGNTEFTSLLKRIAFHETYSYDQSYEEFIGNGEIDYPYAPNIK